VNGTSALLHLLRKSLEHDSTDEFSSKFRFKMECMQEATEAYKASSAIQVLLNEDNMKHEIYQEKEGLYRVEDRVEDIYDVLEKIIDHQVSITGKGANLKFGARKYLEGWDFNDLA